MSIDKLSSSVVKIFFLQLRELRHIRGFIPKTAAILYLQTLLYIPALLIVIASFGLPQYYLHRLKKYKTLLLVMTRTLHCKFLH